MRGAWCNSRLKMQPLNSIRESNFRENILSYSKEKEHGENGGVRGEATRIPLSQQAVVQQQIKSNSTRKDAEKYITFCDSAAQGAKLNTVQYLGIAADEPIRIKRHTRPGIILPLVDIGWDEGCCWRWCEDHDLLSPIYTTSARGGCWFCHNQGVEQLRLLRHNYPDLWELLLKWDNDSPNTFKPDGHTVHDFEKRFTAEDMGLIVAGDTKFRWKSLDTLLSNT